MTFATSLNFTSSNEDGRTEIAALRLAPSDRVLCLTASGTRPLDLLTGDPGEVVALDLNPAQNHLLHLKIAAFRTLSDGELYAYLGLTENGERGQLHARLRTALPEETRLFWDRKMPLIHAGVWHVGRWERVLRFLAGILRRVRGRHVDRLFNAENIAEQESIWAEHFEDWFWTSSIHLLSSRFFWTYIVGEPGGKHLPDRRQTTDRLTAAFRGAAGRFLFRDSEFATLIFYGLPSADRALPLHLQPQNLDIVRARLDRINIRTGDLATLDPPRDGEFTAFSLSDFGSYCDPAAYEACWQGVVRTASRDARFCERSFMNPLAIPDSLAGRIASDPHLSARMSDLDRAIIYDIRAGLIR